MERVSSGNAELDMVLGGGFPKNSINILMGLPGTGKTILAESIIFSSATPEKPALYFSTVSEPLDKMLRYVQHFDFFDPGSIGDAVIYEDLNEVLRTQGLRQAIDHMIRRVKEQDPAFVVVDSFKALHSFAGSSEEFRSMLAEFAAVLSALATTAFFVGEYSTDEVSELPEFAVADGIIELVLNKVGVKDARYIRVLKERGSAFMAGEHAFRISEEGLRVFPRLVTPQDPFAYKVPQTRSATGVSVLDAMVEDGFWKGSSTVVFGPPGCGKTLMGLHFIFKGIEMGEKGFIATLEENPTQLARIANGFGWDMREAIDSGMLELLYVSPVDVYIDEFIATVDARMRQQGTQRLMIDSLNDLEYAAPSRERFRDFMYALVQNTAVKGTSVIMTSEVSNLFSTSVLSEFGISHMSDNVVLIHYLREESEVKRAISVIKTRASNHDPRIRQFHISSGGLEIGEPFVGPVFGPIGG